MRYQMRQAGNEMEAQGLRGEAHGAYIFHVTDGDRLVTLGVAQDGHLLLSRHRLVGVEHHLRMLPSAAVLLDAVREASTQLEAVKEELATQPLRGDVLLVEVRKLRCWR